MQSSLYYDIPESKEYQNLIKKVESYSNEKNMDTFMLKLPKSDINSKSYEHKGCFMLMSPGYKILLINAFASEEEFEDYEEDVKDVINYLYSKYEYRGELGRFSKWGKNLIDTVDSVEELQNLDLFWSSYKIQDKLESRYSQILISLCTGSVNDIKRVKAGLPPTALDEIKQKIQTFDADQTRFIYFESEQKEVKIQGLSGTGKTELLLHKLKVLYQDPAEYKIYVTCHNKILADSLRKRIPSFFNSMKVTTQIEWQSRLWCTNAWGSMGEPNSGLYRYICHLYDIPFYTYNYRTDFDTVCRAAINDLHKKYPSNKIPKYLDYILVDECQDFKDSFSELCQLVTNKQVYLAGDIFQSIFSEHSGKDYKADFFLSKCYRTDPKTLMFSHALGLGLFEKVRLRWLSPQDWEACGYKYTENKNNKQMILTREPVRRFREIDDRYSCMDIIGYHDNDGCTILGKQISKILKDFPTATVDDFCIILVDSDQLIYQTANNIEQYVYNKFGWESNKAYESKRSKPNTLLISNRNNVKGLEYPFVICITKKITSGYVYRNALYTMLSRSFLKTILLLPQHGSGIEKGVIDGYHEIMDHSRMTINIPTTKEQLEIQERFTREKKRRSTNEIIQETIKGFNLDADQALRLERAAQVFDWSDLQEQDIIDKIKHLKEAL